MLGIKSESPKERGIIVFSLIAKLNFFLFTFIYKLYIFLKNDFINLFTIRKIFNFFKYDFIFWFQHLIYKVKLLIFFILLIFRCYLFVLFHYFVFWHKIIFLLAYINLSNKKSSSTFHVFIQLFQKS